MQATPRIDPSSAPFPRDAETLLQHMMPTTAVPPISLFRLMVRNLPMARSAWHLGDYGLGDDLMLSAREREILIDRTCARLGCEYEWAVHVGYFGRRVGLGDDEITSLTHGSSADTCWASDRERALIDAVDALVDTHDIPDDRWAPLRAAFSELEILDVLCLVGWYHALCFLARATRLPLEQATPTFASVRDQRQP